MKKLGLICATLLAGLSLSACNNLASQQSKSSKMSSLKAEHSSLIAESRKQAKNGDTEARIIKQLKDPKNTHPYSYNEIIKQINKRLKQKHVEISFQGSSNVDFNKYHLNMFMKFYNIKDNIKYTYAHQISSSKLYTYSPRLIDFVFKQLSSNPSSALDNLKEGLKKV